MKPLTPRDPKEIGGYTLVNRLGSGGMGDVYVAVKDGENVALKIIRDAFVDDPAYRARFQREIDTLKAVSHPNVIRFVESGIDDGRVWYASEFAGGPDLHKTLTTNGPLEGNAWWDLAHGLINGLSAIHEQNTVHRDIKPANIIMSPFGPKIIDLGIAKGDDETSLTQTGMAPGTPAWFSPEHIDGREVTAASDFYSAGVVLVFAATGTTPWGPPTSVTYLNIAQKMAQAPDLSGLNPEQRQFVEGLLDENPTARLAHAKTLSYVAPPKTQPVFVAESAGEDPHPRVDSPREPRGSRAGAFGVVFALILAAAGLGSYFWGSSLAAGTTIAEAKELAKEFDNQEIRALRSADTFISHVREYNYPRFFPYGSWPWRNGEAFVRANWEVHNLRDWFGVRLDVDSLEKVTDLTIPETPCSEETTFTGLDDVEIFQMSHRDDPEFVSHMLVKDGRPYFIRSFCDLAPESEYDEALRLVNQWEQDLRTAIDSGVDSYLEFIKATTYPDLYDFDTERWVTGEGIVRENWPNYREFAFYEFDYTSAGILDLAINQDDPSCSPARTNFPQSLWILEVVPDSDPYPNYFIIEDGVLYNTYAFCRVLDEEGFPG